MKNSTALKSLVAISLFLSGQAFCQNGGFSLGSTRVIYDGSKDSASITVINSDKAHSFLAQSWIDNYSPASSNAVSGEKAPFIITPPLYRQDEGKNTLRIMRTGGNLPTDRESAFWLNVKAIPGSSDDLSNKNTVQFAYVLRVKLFYRPEGLADKNDPTEAYKHLAFSQKGNHLEAKNSTPYFITLHSIHVNGKEIKDVSAMVPPMGVQDYSLPENTRVKSVNYQAVNDLGGLFEPLTYAF
ncbi:molecular chaperone [Salmonella enterica]|nr:molecular chaperone [Salmonella enterica]EAO4192749.1 molecular chaperone [Salmonella enterica]EIX7381529.1 molecular chaperone [Salmonella enterica]HAE9022053.1 molecular chaperone [Salmonella enterica subsp. enterica serovar Javiana]